jgi:acyl-CoA thioesterase
VTFVIDGLMGSLDLKQVGDDRFQAANATEQHDVVFGGQLMAQAIVAARHGEVEKVVKTLHIIFARPASPKLPIEITVERMHDGRSLASRTVTLSQGDTLCSRALVLLSNEEDDFVRHADPPPGELSPDDATSWPRDLGAWEVRVVDGVDILDPETVGPADLDIWSRFDGAPSDSLTGQALVAFATDMFLIGTAMRAHKGVSEAQAHRTLSTGVLSHTMTFHEAVDASEWLLLSNHSPYAGHGRVYGRANVFGCSGGLVASYVQDSMIRARTSGPGRL